MKVSQVDRVDEIWESALKQAAYLDIIIISPGEWAAKHGVTPQQTLNDIKTIIDGGRLIKTDKQTKYRVRK